MIAELADLLPGFSVVNHTRCFLHVVNLIARSLVRQFDVPKSKKKDPPTANDTPAAPDDDNDPDSALRELAENIDLEDQMTHEALLTEIRDDLNGSDDEEADDDVEGWVDEMAVLSRTERAEVEASSATASPP